MNKIWYLDYNSTSPLADSVKEYLSKGDFVFANPSSSHRLGKIARSEINSTKKAILDQFHFDSDYEIISHSGATEANNWVVENAKKQARVLLYSDLDHPSMSTPAKLYDKSKKIPLNPLGELDLEKLTELLTQNPGAIVHITWAHSESGLLTDLEKMVSLKTNFKDAFFHVDGTQAIGKILHWDHLPGLDMYSFSSHKFGALKGSGFSFIKNKSHWPAFILGGGQQEKYRSGTEDLLSLKTTFLALNEKKEHSSQLTEIYKFKLDLENLFNQYIQAGEIIAQKCQRLLNTSLFLFPHHRSDEILMKLDLKGLMASMGSACSSHSAKASPYLLALGKTDEEAKSAIRLSLGPLSLDPQVLTIWEEVLKQCQK